MKSSKCKEPLSSKFKAKFNSHMNFLTPDFIADHAVSMFFFTILATWIIGIIDVLPSIYQERGCRVILTQRIFVTFLFSEMMVNWLCIRYVDSSYKQYLASRPDQEQGLQDTETHLTEDEGITSKALDKEGLRERFVKPSTMDFTKEGTTNKSGERTLKYSYWSWSPCFTCDVMRPPRCHHCPLCNICVLKRDHHCYFTGSCVGWRNHRHFIVFCFWATLACSYALVHAVYYVYAYLWSSLSIFDLFPPVTVLRCLLGFVSPKILVYLSVGMFLIYFTYMSANFLVNHLVLINSGLTTFEFYNLNTKKVVIHDKRSLNAKLRSIIGTNWALSIFLPLHMIFPATEDPVNWPSIQVTRPSS